MFLTSWRTFWRHNDFFWRHEMFLTSSQNLDIFLTFSRHDVFLTSWQTFFDITDVLTSRHLFDVMTNLLSNDEPFVIMTCVDIMANFITSWLVYDMTHFGFDKRVGAMTYATLIDVMTNVLTSWNFLTTWHTSWRLDALCDVMTHFVSFMTSWCVLRFAGMDKYIMKTCFLYNYKLLVVKMNFLMSWRVFVFMTNCLTLWRIFDFMTHFLTSWHIFYFMTNLWRHDKPFDVMVCFDAMTHFVTSWRTWWRHYDFFFILW